MWTLRLKSHSSSVLCNVLVLSLTCGMFKKLVVKRLNFSWFAPHLEIFRGFGVIGYYVAKLFDKDGILPNRIFMISFFGLSTILWTAYEIRNVN